MSAPKIVDLSKYQAGFDFFAFQQSGGIAVICKASEGASLRDSCYQSFRQQAQSAGLAFASYHFLRDGDMAAQAKFFLSVVDPDQGERVVADYEDDSVSLTDLKTFLQTIRDARPDLQLTVYGSNVLEETLGSQGDEWLADNTSLWTAAYNKSGPGSYPQQVWPAWSLWQYTDNANCPGFDGPVDGDEFNGSDELCLKWFGPASAPAPPHPADPTVTITTSGKVTVIVNGKEITT
jgi:GH25 family lysozyme M1 (1,4-beta-N-acetylmuramidase)